MNKDVPVFVAVGRRKTSTARVRIASGSGQIVINDKPLETYCFTEALAKTATRPLGVNHGRTGARTVKTGKTKEKRGNKGREGNREY